jgi:hypothetical protein
MKATLEISGNRALGFELTLRLPRAWLNNFNKHCKVLIMRNALDDDWGHPSGNDEFQIRTEFVLEFNATFARKQEIAAEIEAAKKTLNIKIDETLEIDL